MSRVVWVVGLAQTKAWQIKGVFICEMSLRYYYIREISILLSWRVRRNSSLWFLRPFAFHERIRRELTV